MDKNNDILLGDLQRLQEAVNNIVSKVGVEKAVHLFEGIYNNTALSVDKIEKVKYITGFIISQSIAIFNLQEDEFLTSEILEYRQARMACYHLIKQYTDISYAKIGEMFGRKKRSIMYFHNKAKELLSVPQFYRGFSEKHQLLDKATLEFIGKLN